MGLYLESGYANMHDIMNKDDTFVFVIGPRGSGKTYGALLEILESGKKFIYLRRTQTEADLVSSEVVNPFKKVIEDHFAPDPDLVALLRSRGKDAYADEVERVGNMNVSYVYQEEALGLGHAVRCAAEKTGDEAFYVLLGDVLVPNNKMLPRMQEISDAHGGASVIAVMPVAHDEVNRFGVIAGEAVADDVWKIDALVEKPAPEDAPSNLAVFGRYLLSPRVMELLADVEPGVGGEIQLTDALDAVLKEEEMYALIIDPADGFDTGTVESWLETNNVLMQQAN